MFSPVQPAVYFNNTTQFKPSELSAANPAVGKEGVFAMGGDSCPLLGTVQSVSPNLCAHFLYRNWKFFWSGTIQELYFVGEV